MTIRYERFDHPESDGPKWTVLAFVGSKSVGGYIGPGHDHPDACRCYVDIAPYDPRSPGSNLVSRDIPEAQCRGFIKQNAHRPVI